MTIKGLKRRQVRVLSFQLRFQFAERGLKKVTHRVAFFDYKKGGDGK